MVYAKNIPKEKKQPFSLNTKKTVFYCSELTISSLIREISASCKLSVLAEDSQITTVTWFFWILNQLITHRSLGWTSAT